MLVSLGDWGVNSFPWLTSRRPLFGDRAEEIEIQRC
jgi:hypothetical protein